MKYITIILSLCFIVAGCGEREGYYRNKGEYISVNLKRNDIIGKTTLKFKVMPGEKLIPGSSIDSLLLDDKEMAIDFKFDGSIAVIGDQVRVMLTMSRKDGTPVSISSYTTQEQQGPGLFDLLLGDHKTRTVSVTHTNEIYSEPFEMNGDYVIKNGLTSR